MLCRTKDLNDLDVIATDGSIGDVKDLYFDDQAWTIRYLVVDVGSWLASRKVLISPLAIYKADWEAGVLPVSLTREQIKNSPDIDTDKPVTRQHESNYLAYYNYPYYWGGLDAGMFGGGGYSGMLPRGEAGDLNPGATNQSLTGDAGQGRQADHHLRSCSAVTGYHIDAIDGELGKVKELLVDDDSWAIRYLVVSTGSWWLGHAVLLTPQWVTSVSWEEQTMAVDLTRDTLKRAPSYDSELPLSPDLEAAVQSHYRQARSDKASS